MGINCNGRSNKITVLFIVLLALVAIANIIVFIWALTQGRFLVSMIYLIFMSLGMAIGMPLSHDWDDYKRYEGKWNIKK